MSLYEDYIAVSRYARYLPEQQRREDWGETVDRYVNYFSEKFSLPTLLSSELREAIYSKNVMPSMRCLMTAGEALTRDNIAGYNLSLIHI